MPHRRAGGTRTMSFAVVTRRALRPLGVAEQLVEFCGAEAVMVRETPGCRRASAPSDRNVAKNFSGRPIPAKASRRAPASRSPAIGVSDACKHRHARGLVEPIQAARLRFGAEQHDGVGAGKTARKALAQRTGRDHPPIAKAVVGIDDDQRQGLCRSWGSETRHRAGSAPAPAATAARTPAARSRATQHGARAASSNASSPTAAASWRAGSTRTGPTSRPP